MRGYGGPLQEIPIIAITAFAQQEDREAALAAGADGYLTKPIRKGELDATLEALSSDPQRVDREVGDGGPNAEFEEADLAEQRDGVGREWIAPF
jgi:DNA-binding response OmpR family regulator